jgi:hypothetical protein
MEMRMAEIVRLQDRLATQPKRPGEPGEAKILLFTGVRYERWTSADDDRPQKRTGGVKRKKH